MPWWIEADRQKSTASVDFPMAGRAATMIIWPGWSPPVSSSSSMKPVGTPVSAPLSRFWAASISRLASPRSSETAT